MTGPQRITAPSLAPAALAITSALLLAGCAGPWGTGSRLDGKSTLDPAGGFSSSNILGDPSAYVVGDAFARVLQAGSLVARAGEVLQLSSTVDQAAIEVGIVRPDAPGRFPVILHATPYHPILQADVLGYQNSELKEGFLVENFVPHGYAVVLLALRGTGGSGGCWNWDGPEERADLAQVVTWLSEQDWAGPIGVIGRSYGAHPPFIIAGQAHPNVKTIVAMQSEPDAYTWVVRNGTVAVIGPIQSTASVPFFSAVYPQQLAANPGNLALMQDYARAASRFAGRACPEAAFPAQEGAALAATPDRGAGFFAERDLRTDVLEKFRGSVFLVHSFPDGWAPMHLVEPLGADIEARGIPLKRIYGQWGHSQIENPPDTGPRFPTANPAWQGRWDFGEILLRWFDYWLKGDLSVDLGPRVQVADSEGTWRSEDTWPPLDASTTVFHLGAGGVLSAEPTDTGSVTVGPNPRRIVVDLDESASMIDRCDACQEFRTEPFASTLRIVGSPTLPLTVVPRGPGGHVTAELFVEKPGSGLGAIGWGQMDLRYADGGETARTVAPGAAIRLAMELEPMDAIVPAGAKLVLRLSQGGYGDPTNVFYYRGPTPTYPVDVAYGDGQGELRLLSIERAAEDSRFFLPPGVRLP